MSTQKRTAVIFWLSLCTAMIACMVLVGGITRLTESGLSIVEWKPVTGVLPPIGQTAWEEEFYKYQQTPEYIHKNEGMTLSAFKQIFFWEYLHRLLGRLVGVVFFVPYLYFLATKQLQGALKNRCLVIFLLGALQGLIGWYMVKSGLVDRPDVSQYRLATHLSMAFLLYGSILWTILDIKHKDKGGRISSYLPTPPSWLRYYAYAITGSIAIQVISGAFVAGLNAGLIYNTFPSMNGKFIPEEVLHLQPWYLNAFENITTVQFDHRMWAMFTSSLIIGLWFIIKKKNVHGTLCHIERNKVHCLLMMLVVQFALGVTTLLHGVPTALASMHQLGALALFSLSIVVSHALFSRNRVGVAKKSVIYGELPKVV